MTTMDWTRAAKYALMVDFLKGFGLGFRYFVKPKSTLMSGAPLTAATS